MGFDESCNNEFQTCWNWSYRRSCDFQPVLANDTFEQPHSSNIYFFYISYQRQFSIIY